MQQKRSFAQAFSVLLLIGVFACCALLTAALSAGALNRVSARADASYETRTSLLYIEQKLRACASRGDIRVEASAAGDRLVLRSELAGAAYDTCIYAADGALCEVTVPAGADAGAGGQRVTDADALYVEEKAGGLYEVRVVCGEAQASVLVYVQAEGGRA